MTCDRRRLEMNHLKENIALAFKLYNEQEAEIIELLDVCCYMRQDLIELGCSGRPCVVLANRVIAKAEATYRGE